MATEPLDPIPLSALQYWACCPRQCVLFHVEQVFEENLFTNCATACASSGPCRCFVIGSAREAWIGSIWAYGQPEKQPIFGKPEIIHLRRK